MHAIPAATTLIITALLWLLTTAPDARATEVLAPAELNQWSSYCDQCELEAQYDVMLGPVIRIAAEGGYASLSRDLDLPLQAPLLSWHWSADRFADPGPMILITLNFHDTDEWPERVLHYLWDSSRKAGEQDTVSDFEHLLVVTGEEARAEHWYEVSRDLSDDWQTFYNDPLPPLESVQISLNPAGNKSWNGTFIDGLSLTEPEQLPAPPPAIATDE
tara:strand:+ start:22925 stop:23575 length:651 start_codon:yes stop_codon:yes gene_type:complete